MPSDPRDIVRRWFEEVWNQRRTDTIDELMDDASLCYTDSGPVRGRQEFRQKMFEPFLAAFPDLHLEVEDILAEGDQVVVRWMARGTHAGAGLGFEKTDRPVHIRGMSWIRLRDGRFADGWQVSNLNEVIASLRS